MHENCLKVCTLLIGMASLDQVFADYNPREEDLFPSLVDYDNVIFELENCTNCSDKVKNIITNDARNSFQKCGHCGEVLMDFSQPSIGF